LLGEITITNSDPLGNASHTWPFPQVVGAVTQIHHSECWAEAAEIDTTAGGVTTPCCWAGVKRCGLDLIIKCKALRLDLCHGTSFTKKAGNLRRGKVENL
jgi:hypothetical protein